MGELARSPRPPGLRKRARAPAKLSPRPQDFFQLLGPRVRLLRLIKSPKKTALAPGSPFYTLEDFEAEHALGDAALWADVMALQARKGGGRAGGRSAPRGGGCSGALVWVWRSSGEA